MTCVKLSRFGFFSPHIIVCYSCICLSLRLLFCREEMKRHFHYFSCLVFFILLALHNAMKPFLIYLQKELNCNHFTQLFVSLSEKEKEKRTRPLGSLTKMKKKSFMGPVNLWKVPPVQTGIIPQIKVGNCESV